MNVRRDVVNRLNQLKTAYYVTGSEALAIHGLAYRQSNDIDFVLGIRPQDYETQVRRAFEPDYYVAPLVAVNGRWMGAATHVTEIGKADLIMRESGPWAQAAMSRRQAVDDADLGATWVSSREDLLLAKIEWSEGNLESFQGRDIAAILRESAALDWRYVMEHAASLGITAWLAEARRRA